MIRVLHVFGCLERGGAETMIMNYYRHIDRTKIQFDAITHLKAIGSYESEIISLGGKIYRLPRFKGYNIIQYIYAWDKLLSIHREWDIIHIHTFTIAGLILPIAKKYDIKIRITHSHNTIKNFSLFKGIANLLLKRIALKYSTNFWACGQEAGMHYFGNNKFKIMKNAINTSNYNFSKEVRKLKRKELECNGKLIIGHIGSFRIEKNHSFIIDIFAYIHKINNNAILLLIGDGALRVQIEQKVQNLNLSNNVILTGTRSDIPELLQAMDVFLFPSLFEGLGLVVIEAQAAGLSSIISDTVPNEAMITTLTHKMQLSANAEEWATEVLKYAEIRERKNMYETICNSGYDISANVKWLESYYSKLVDSTR